MKTISSKEVIERLKIALKLSSDNALAETLGISKTTLSNWKSRNSIDISLLFSKCERISIDWLLTGNGPMLKTKDSTQSHIADKEATTYPKGAKNKTVYKKNDEENSIAEAILSEPSVSYTLSKGAPYYDVDFLGGFDLTFNDQTVNPEYNIDFKPFNKPGVSWVNITGHSMEPKINHGDIIALKECRLEDVQYGEIYAVVLDTIRTVKILRKAKSPDRMRYIPINEENYDEQEYDNSRIVRIFEVLGNISRFI